MSSIVTTIKRYPVAVGAGLAAAVLGGLFFVRGNTVPALEVREAELVAEVSLIESNAQSATGLTDHLEVLEGRLEEIDARLFDREKVAVNTNFFYDLDEQLGAEVKSVAQSAELKAAGSNANRGIRGYTIITYNLSVGGTFPELVEFLQAIEAVDPFARVSNFEVKGGNAQDGGLNLNLQVEVLGRLES